MNSQEINDIVNKVVAALASNGVQETSTAMTTEATSDLSELPSLSSIVVPTPSLAKPYQVKLLDTDYSFKDL